MLLFGHKPPKLISTLFNIFLLREKKESLQAFSSEQDDWSSNRQIEDEESKRGEERRGRTFRELFSSLDYSGDKAGDNTSFYVLLLCLAHNDKHTFPFITFNFAQWFVNTSLPFVLLLLTTLRFCKPSVNVKACICAVVVNRVFFVCVLILKHLF